MSIKHLGESFDIHGGGADLIFPHHENEITQSEAFTGKPFVKYWLHNGFITIDREKMSKSLGNFFTIEEVLAKYDPEVVRFFLLSTHYRSPIEFSDEQLKEAEASLDRFYATRIRIDDFLSVRGDSAGEKISSVAVSASSDKTFEETIDSFKGKFDSAMGDDFNTALALGYIFELVREINRFLDSMPSGEKARQLAINALNAILDAGRVFNLFRRTPKEWYLALKDMKGIPLSEAEILSRIHERQEARYRKDWAAADTIRKELEESGILLEDKKDKTDWKVKV
jgi:cysteinyl-tRNA synthetase